MVICLFSSSAYAISITDSTVNNNTPTEQVQADNSVITLLEQMKKAVLQTDYQFYFTVQEEAEYPISLKYTHLGTDNSSKSSLLYLEGATKEIILHDNMVSYFQSDSVSFSLTANHIIEAFPDVIYNDYAKLSHYYDFVLLGKARTANRSAQLVRVIPKDKDRYNYVIWIDEESHLPLRIDLLDLNSKIIKQMKVLGLKFDFDKAEFARYIEDRDYPILFPIEKENSKLNKWQIVWLPKGFTETAAYNVNFYNADIDTRLFSDGIFSFSINISEEPTNKMTHVFTQGTKTIYSVNIDGINIVIIGNLPLETIVRIASNIKPK